MRNYLVTIGLLIALAISLMTAMNHYMEARQAQKITEIVTGCLNAGGEVKTESVFFGLALAVTCE